MLDASFGMRSLGLGNFEYCARSGALTIAAGGASQETKLCFLDNYGDSPKSKRTCQYLLIRPFALA